MALRLSSLNETYVNKHLPVDGQQPCRCLSSRGPPSVEETAKGESEVERGPPKLRSAIPIEVLELIFSYLSKTELIPVLQSNKSLHSAAIRVLYRELSAESPASSIKLIHRVLDKPLVHRYIRSVDLNVSSVDTLTGNYYRLLRRFLQRLPGLTTLILDLPKSNSPVWIFAGCTFLLRTFSTSMQCSADLARFLDSQPNIQNLTLRGFQTDSFQTVAQFGIDIASNPSALFAPRRNFRDFVLQPGSLPRLANFNAIHAGPPVVATVARGRPVSVASVPLFSPGALESLDALSGGSVPLRRLTVISFDPAAPSFIFEEVAKRFPSLEALHIVILLAEFNSDLLLAACPHLERLKHLKYITCVATSSDEAPLSEEQEIAETWHKHCPSLQTIILPRGKVWFQAPAASPRKGKGWACFDDEDDS
ncbi:hypothetical protein CC1G_04737 [Coprinopsis cinerea okayama7|uniref:F-box domain-containing protein n=1 Tax=Coprinopsis cinerea (strain Okayama-7 / 130 / ATCC MYA-4618 / FGSC 9003) TaxID=240176 RepID=A8P2D5_COPC7|nr:hypothetical protein CC1G_04737 [Coprinopsis cinerea okayama7\|eukprot:XP_001838293.2 hypothetical protein CC1G_04737 [Coprinopsis cinerea okayama7\